jgi:hypothetical protein
VVIWFVINEPFFFLFSLLLEKYMLTIFVVCISTSILTLLIFFILSFLYKFYLFSILSFNFNLPNIIFSNLVSSFFWFLIFFLGFFIKVLLVFNFIIQFKLMVLCFFDLVLIILISNFFSWFFRKSYYSF